MRIIVVMVALLQATAASADLRAGVARVDITPAGSMALYGYANRPCGPVSTGTHDPLHAKVLVLESAGTRLAIVTLDLGSMLSERLRRDVGSRLGIPVLLQAASHTHAAPAFLREDSNPQARASAQAYLAELEAKVFDAVDAASRAMTPVTLSVARSSLQLGYNRLLPGKGGRARTLFDNLERIPYGPVDPELVVLRVDRVPSAGAAAAPDSTDDSGSPLALLVHYATHPVVLGPTNCKFSADFPGVLQAEVEAALPGSQVMFVQGGAGDINPIFMARSSDEARDFGVVQKMGATLAAEVVDATRRAAAVPRGTPGIASRSEIVTVKDRWDAARTIDIGITTVLIDGTVAIATFPGEVMHRLQLAWKARAEVAVPLFYGYTYSAGGDLAGYVPDLRSAAHGGYGADTDTRVEVGTGERLVERHLINLYALQGMWVEKTRAP